MEASIKGQKQLFSSNKNNHRTPPWLFNYYDDMFHFEWDLAADDFNALAPNWYTAEEDALKQRWQGQCWLNPPFDYNREFVKHLTSELIRNYLEGTFLGVHLCIPSRTDTLYFQDCRGFTNNIDLVKGRVAFIDPDAKPEYDKKGRLKEPGAPFPTSVLYLTTEKIDDPEPCVIYSLERDKISGVIERILW